jgi:hypothetical protein
MGDGFVGDGFAAVGDRVSDISILWMLRDGVASSAWNLPGSGSENHGLVT